MRVGIDWTLVLSLYLERLTIARSPYPLSMLDSNRSMGEKAGRIESGALVHARLGV